MLRGLLVGFTLALAVGGLTHAGTTVVDATFVIGFVLGAIASVTERQEAQRTRVNQLAARQERQARLIADAIAERDARQQLGEYNTN